MEPLRGAMLPLSYLPLKMSFMLIYAICALFANLMLILNGRYLKMSLNP